MSVDTLAAIKQPRRMRYRRGVDLARDCPSKLRAGRERSHVDAAPAPAPGKLAKEKLETLKKKLPDIVSSWAKKHWYDNYTVEVRVVRMVGPTQAKVVVMSRWADSQGNPVPQNDEVFTIFLDFYDGAWSATRFDASWSVTDNFSTKAIRFLMLAIDEAAEM